MKAKLHTAWGHVLFFVYLAALLRLTVFRSGAFSHALFSGRFNLPPGVAYMQLLSWGSYFHAFYLFFGNIAWFMPLGMYLRWRGRSFFICLVYGAGLSFLIEAAQYILGCGVTETDDLLLNTLGAALGVILFELIRKIRK